MLEYHNENMNEISTTTKKQNNLNISTDIRRYNSSNIETGKKFFKKRFIQ